MTRNIDYYYYYLLQHTKTIEDTNTLIRKLDSLLDFAYNDPDKSKLYNFIVWLNQEHKKNED